MKENFWEISPSQNMLLPIKNIFNEQYARDISRKIHASVLTKQKAGEHYRNSNHMDNASYWRYSTIHRILQNEMYLGNMVQGRKYQHMRGRAQTKQPEDWIIVPGTHDATIDNDTWEKKQDLLNRRTRNLDLTSNPSVLAGFLKCGDCGRALVKKNNASSTCYYCGIYVRSGHQACTPHKIPYNILENILLEDLNAILHHVNALEDLIMNQNLIMT